MDRARRLLERGYFPVQLPPSFTTQELADRHLELRNAWTALRSAPKRNGTQVSEMKVEIYSQARAGLQRRIIGIPNPVAQTFLAALVADHWGELLKHYRTSKLSASRPKIQPAGERAAKIPSMHNLYDRRVKQSAGYRFLLRTDVSRFFPTIYTHSIPWALNGKQWAKRNRTAKVLGNMLDAAQRLGQDGQTIGLPIGPDTSHIIAEAIAVAVDLKFKDLQGGATPPGFRYVDDYFLFFDSADKAETALVNLTRALKEFELQVNFEKTEVRPVIEIQEDYWPHQLSSFTISPKGKSQISDLHHFFELAKDLARKNSDENVMAYALKKASSILIKKPSWEAFEAHVCHIALAYPNTLQVVARIFSTYDNFGYPLTRPRIERLLNAIIEHHAPLEHHSEVAWALWLTRTLGTNITKTNVECVSNVHSSACALLLMDLEANGRLPVRPLTTLWHTLMFPEELDGDLWLLSYEAGLRGWGGMTDAHIKQHPYFEELRSRGIRFYDESLSVEPLFQVKDAAREELQGAPVSSLFDKPDAEKLIDYVGTGGGYDDEDYMSDEDDDPLEEDGDS